VADLHSLAARAEAAEGPDRQLDALICIVAGFAEGNTVAFKTGWCAGSETNPRPVEAPAYTASLDAALTLVPDGWSVFLLRLPEGRGEASLLEFGEPDEKGKRWRRADMIDTGRCTASTPALALVAACLKARATQGENDA
jgi:hypothetical protein